MSATMLPPSSATSSAEAFMTDDADIVVVVPARAPAARSAVVAAHEKGKAGPSAPSPCGRSRRAPSRPPSLRRRPTCRWR